MRHARDDRRSDLSCQAGPAPDRGDASSAQGRRGWTAVTLQTFEFTRRVERWQAELRDDLEVTIKMEFGGGFANLKTAVETSVERIEGRFDALAERVESLEEKA
ncbi:hypothetical protein [Jiella avicenniae]|uniref:Uncharacterized protein n=1 Tax=Jiella avicenniae TaxID=2907202 RepID=A0A9X1P1Z2_9HYPH|nr:hypothetical protein [Jiella avicenniae]MCE7027816.1 hypothetical protein [Jiella avicenniae]